MTDLSNMHIYECVTEEKVNHMYNHTLEKLVVIVIFLVIDDLVLLSFIMCDK